MIKAADYSTRKDNQVVRTADGTFMVIVNDGEDYIVRCAKHNRKLHNAVMDHDIKTVRKWVFRPEARRDVIINFRFQDTVDADRLVMKQIAVDLIPETGVGSDWMTA